MEWASCGMGILPVTIFGRAGCPLYSYSARRLTQRSLFPAPYSLLPTPCSLLPVPYCL
ncbi:MAG: hypothetical protein F6J94_31885 [Moorea sp. SIO1F2]|uniref:hypothetical protein n=1 Tax=unclassified Moorena TaxID=2683338 RepID=UPI0013BA55DE|nr:MULTISPECIES: hypothetical protein [unclassified Moorena]NEN94858.1 hypothetical protein [Moorena sp. SIO3I7]NEQ79840.1 hypothetical protein [Moorena sp. SIO2I5]NEO04453.1 hypothetical protein [Moorena sp. SIO3I8]NEO21245.1 hypothetical protein [Moorena sp. SIO4A5]NEP22318.1 hypothetical protein [Moorena sp. SIO3I6]